MNLTSSENVTMNSSKSSCPLSIVCFIYHHLIDFIRRLAFTSFFCLLDQDIALIIKMIIYLGENEYIFEQLELCSIAFVLYFFSQYSTHRRKIVSIIHMQTKLVPHSFIFFCPQESKREREKETNVCITFIISDRCR